MSTTFGGAVVVVAVVAPLRLVASAAVTSLVAAAAAIALDMNAALLSENAFRGAAPSGRGNGSRGGSAGTRRLIAGMSEKLGIGAGSKVGDGSRFSASASSGSTSSIVQYVDGFDSSCRSREPAFSSIAFSQAMCVLRACLRTPAHAE